MTQFKIICACLVVFVLGFELCFVTNRLDADNYLHRNIVILGENVSSELATRYANKYNASVLYKKSRGFMTDTFSNAARGALGPSRAMKDIIKVLKELNGSGEYWNLIIPESAQRYFLVTLRNMEEGDVNNAQGEVILLDARHVQEIKVEVERVFGYGFTVKAYSSD